MSEKSNKKQTSKSVKKTNNASKQNKRKKIPRNKNQQINKEKPKGAFIGDRNTGAISAAGVRSNIMVQTACEPLAIEAAPLGLMTKAFTVGYDANDNGVGPMYWAYIAFINDLIAIMTNNTTAVYGRLQYLNHILATLMPKSIPYKVGTLSYGWTNADSITTPNKVGVRGYFYYLYVQSTNTNPGGWIVQLPPPNPVDDKAALAALVKFYNLIANSSKNWLKYRTDISFGTDYVHDASAFAQVSPYYGSGNSINASGAAVSQDLEVPYASVLAGVFCPYSSDNGRIGNVFHRGSCDSTFLLSAPTDPIFHYDNLRTCYAPALGFIDIDEIAFLMMNYMYNLIQHGLKDINVGSTIVQSGVVQSMTAFSYSPQQFRLAVSMALRSFFADEVAATQHLRYSDASNSFEPLRCGSNCYPPTYNSGNFNLPIPLVENLRMLKAKGYRIPTNFENAKNKLFYYPVLGVYRAAPPPNIFSGNFIDVETGNVTTSNMFTGSSADDPNVIDGTDANGNVCDLNRSPVINDIIAEWNQRQGDLAQYSTATGVLAGASNGCLLTFTRFAQYRNEEIDVSTVSPFLRRNLNKSHVKKVPIVRRQSQTKFSKDQIEEYKEIYIPPNSSLDVQFTQSYSSVSTITEAKKSFLAYFIFPTIVLEEDDVPTQQEVRIANYQSQLLVVPQQVGQFISRAQEIIVLSAKFAPGTAGAKTDEMSDVIAEMGRVGQGGWLGDALGAVAGIVAPLLPF